MKRPPRVTPPGSDSRVGASVSQRFPDESLKEKKRERETAENLLQDWGAQGQGQRPLLGPC